MFRHTRAIARAAIALAFIVIVLGAFVRLSDAGLGCPDWPTCYGKATWPTLDADIARANDAFPERPVELHKAWREQIHRHLAAGLGLLVLILALGSNWAQPMRRWLLAAAAVAAAAGTFAWIAGLATLSAGLSLVALGLPLALAIVPGLASGGRPLPDWARYCAFLFALIMFQAILGMWTVTWKLKPIVVMAHLLGGLAVFSMLVWIGHRSRSAAGRMFVPLPAPASVLSALRTWVWLGLAVLVLQIALGGWTSANYAALACGTDFPRCLGQWWPATDFGEAFVLWRGIGVDYEGGLLDGPARTAIQLAHRIGAVVTVAMVLALVAVLRRQPALRRPAWVLLALLTAQVALGIANVWFGLPLPVASAHNAVAALLVAAMVVILSRLTPRRD
ncbi:MAG: COX15/CtaA family protein [Xanthomonadales bacterium]|nr:COX15/CtaA family protein [Xanthomonadales bacterium]